MGPGPTATECEKKSSSRWRDGKRVLARTVSRSRSDGSNSYAVRLQRWVKMEEVGCTDL